MMAYITNFMDFMLLKVLLCGSDLTELGFREGLGGFRVDFVDKVVHNFDKLYFI